MDGKVKVKAEITVSVTHRHTRGAEVHFNIGIRFR